VNPGLNGDPMLPEKTDVAIVGAGIVGLATAYQISERYPQLSICVVEKEPQVAQHQSGHNSGVLHSGIYYKPGSLKARNCREGRQAMEQFCATHGIPFAQCGKVIVAVNDRELPALQRIFDRGCENGVRCELIGPERLRELEPHAAGVQAIHVPEAGIVDFPLVCEKLAELIQQRGGTIATRTRVTKILRRMQQVVVETDGGSVQASHLINCAGLYSDRVVEMSGEEAGAKIVPFRGEYYELKSDAFHLCRNLIYPVPDPKFPFLGVHFTRMIRGGVECGPNAVLALAREGYRVGDFRWKELAESLSYRGFRRLAWRHWRMGLGEMYRSLSKSAFVRALRHLVPDLRGDQLASGRSGVRAQAVLPDGKMVDDFLIQQTGPLIHVVNAPSPAATAALTIGNAIVDRLPVSP
jgi:L-2-hydroxyglutarate oxidase